MILIIVLAVALITMIVIAFAEWFDSFRNTDEYVESSRKEGDGK